MTSLAPHMEAFLREHLVRHRGASQHTCDSYAYSFQSLFEFAAGKLKVAPSALMLEQLDATLVSGFLEHLETTRGNSAETRNIRLAAVRSFFRFLQHREPAAIEQVRRVLAIPFKKTDTVPWRRRPSPAGICSAIRTFTGPRPSGLLLTPLSEMPGPTQPALPRLCPPGTSDKDLALHVGLATRTFRLARSR